MYSDDEVETDHKISNSPINACGDGSFINSSANLVSNNDSSSAMTAEDNVESDNSSEEVVSDDACEKLDPNQDQLLAYLRQSHRSCEELDLPATCSLLERPDGSKLYLIGTAHFSRESCEDVQKVISLVQPDAVVIELCAARTQILTVDEDDLTKISDESGFKQLKKCVQQKGVLSGLVLYTMLYMSAHITKQLGMAPGSEFRAAFNEIKHVPGCVLYLGDRPISITLQRMMASLSFWQKIRFGLMLLQELKPISAEDVEKLKQQDIFEQLLQEMLVEFPHMTKVLVSERDMYITGYLQRVMKTPIVLPGHVQAPPIVVGVFGIGHCNGIKENYPYEVTAEQMDEIQKLPPPSKSRKVIKFTLKSAMFVISVFTAYKLSKWFDFHPNFNRWS